MSAIKNLPPEQKKNHYRTLVALVRTEGCTPPEEEGVLRRVAEKWEIDGEDARDVINHLEDTRAVFPETPLARFHQLYDLVAIMVSDGGLTPCEERLCRLVASALGFPEDAVPRIRDGILEGLSYGMPNAEVHNRLRREIETLCA